MIRYSEHNSSSVRIIQFASFILDTAYFLSVVCIHKDIPKIN
jgi:hypothetical protein